MDAILPKCTDGAALGLAVLLIVIVALIILAPTKTVAVALAVTAFAAYYGWTWVVRPALALGAAARAADRLLESPYGGEEPGPAPVDRQKGRESMRAAPVVQAGAVCPAAVEAVQSALDEPAPAAATGAAPPAPAVGYLGAIELDPEDGCAEACEEGGCDVDTQFSTVDELAARQGLRRNDGQRVIAGAMRQRCVIGPIFAPELAREEQRDWYGAYDY